VLLSGVVESTEGTPVALQAAEIVSIKEPLTTPLELFTNRRGKFTIEGLKPGAYELRLLASPQSKVRFEIPEGKAGLYDIGKLALPAAVGNENGGK